MSSTGTTGTPSLFHDRYRTTSVVRPRTAISAQQEAGDPTIRLLDLKSALDDLNSEKPQDESRSLAYLTRAIRGADLRVLRDSDVQIGIARYIKRQASPKEQSNGEVTVDKAAVDKLKDLFFNSTSSSRFLNVLDESIDRYGKDRDFLTGLKLFIGQDKENRVATIADVLYPGLTRTNKDGTQVLDPNSPTMVSLESASHNPLVSALAIFAKAAGLEESMQDTISHLKSPTSTDILGTNITRNEAEAYVRSKLPYLFDSNSHELILGEPFGRLGPTSISSEDKQKRLGIQAGMKDPFRGGFDPYEMVVSAIMAPKSEKIEVLHRGLAYLFKLQVIEKEKAEERDRLSTSGPSRANMVDKKFEVIRQRLITGLSADPLLKQAIITAFSHAPLSKDSLDMLTSGVVDKRRAEITETIVRDISLQAQHRNPNLQGLTVSDGGNGFTVTHVDLRNFNESQRTVDKLYKDDRGTESLEEVVSNVRDAHEATVKAISEDIHHTLGEQNTSFTPTDLNEYKDRLKSDRRNVSDNFAAQLDYFSQKLDEAFGSSSGKNLTKFSSKVSSDEARAVTDEIVNKLFPSSDLIKLRERNDVQQAISSLQQAIELNSGVGSAVRSLFDTVSKADLASPRNTGVLNAPNAQRQSLIASALNRHADGIITTKFLADKPKSTDLAANLNADSIKTLAERDTDEGKDLKAIIKRLDGVRRDNFSDIFSKPEQGKSSALRMLFYKDPYTGEAAPNTNLTGLALLFGEISSEETKKFIIKELMIDKKEQRFQADTPAEKEELIDARAQEILNAIESVRVKHDIQLHSNDRHSVVSNFEDLHAIASNATKYGIEMDKARTRISQAIIQGAKDIGNYNVANYTKANGTPLEAATTTALSSLLNGLQLTSLLPNDTMLIGPSGGIGGALPSQVTIANLDTAIDQLEREASLNGISRNAVSLLQNLKSLKTSLQETVGKRVGTEIVGKACDDITAIMTYLQSKKPAEREHMGVDKALIDKFKAVVTDFTNSSLTDATTLSRWMNSTTINGAVGESPRNILNALMSKIKRFDSAEGVTKSFDDWSDLAIKYFNWFDEAQVQFNYGINVVRNAVEEHVSGFVTFVTPNANRDDTIALIKKTESLIKPYTLGQGMTEIGMQDPLKFLEKKAGSDDKLKNFLSILFKGIQTYLPKSVSDIKNMLSTQRQLGFVQQLLSDLAESIRGTNQDEAKKQAEVPTSERKDVTLAKDDSERSTARSDTRAEQKQLAP